MLQKHGRRQFAAHASPLHWKQERHPLYVKRFGTWTFPATPAKKKCSPQYIKKTTNGQDARSPVTSPFTLHLNHVHPCKFSRARRNAHSARHEARLSSSKRVNLVGSTAFSDEVFMLGKTTVRSAVSPNAGGAPILKSPVTEDCVQHGGHQPEDEVKYDFETDLCFCFNFATEARALASRLRWHVRDSFIHFLYSHDDTTKY
jgi:hypothetical protein